jgi:hypothetical protein
MEKTEAVVLSPEDFEKLKSIKDRLYNDQRSWKLDEQRDLAKVLDAVLGNAIEIEL